jgi:hypothetical protein
MEGRIEANYFLARLTKNKNYGNIFFGDRMLAILQGKGIIKIKFCKKMDIYFYLMTF